MNLTPPYCSKFDLNNNIIEDEKYTHQAHISYFFRLF